MTDQQNTTTPSQAPQHTTKYSGRSGSLALVIFYVPALLLVIVFASRAEPLPVNAAIAAVGLFLVLTLAPVFIALHRRNSESARGTDSRLDALSEQVRLIAEQVTLSDEARRVLGRHAEREILRQAIEEEIAAGDFDAAMVLVKELADRCGRRADSEEFRRRIDKQRAATFERDVSAAIGYLDGLIAERRWDVAFADAARIQRLYPDSARTIGLRDRVERARLAYRSELERKFLIAAKEDRVSEAIDVLKELDLYLTEQEAEPLRELARGVIGRARDNLGAEFKIAVQDKRWRHAASIGERIVNEFPNTRMAEEIRGVIDGIRERAQG